HFSRPLSCYGCGGRKELSFILPIVRGCFCLSVRKGKWKGTGMIGEGTRREGIGKYNYHCQKLHVKFIMNKTQSSIQAINPQSADGSRHSKEHSTVTLSDGIAAVSVRFERGEPED